MEVIKDGRKTIYKCGSKPEKPVKKNKDKVKDYKEPLPSYEEAYKNQEDE